MTQHRLGGGKDVGAECFAVAGDLLSVAAESSLDLRPIGVVAAGRGAARVGKKPAATVDDDHPAADAGG
jgi:hypothetical protein